jgi:hypothetical protein
MAKEPDNLVLKLLREMRASIDDLRVDSKEMKAGFQEMREEMQAWQGTVASAAGFAVHANSRSDKIEKELADLRRRVEKLESAR